VTKDPRKPFSPSFFHLSLSSLSSLSPSNVKKLESKKDHNLSRSLSLALSRSLEKKNIEISLCLPPLQKRKTKKRRKEEKKRKKFHFFSLCLLLVLPSYW
jgi:hypothetical protein